MIQPLKIDPDAIFDDRSLAQAVGLSATAFRDARKAGVLEGVKRGRKTFYTGAAVRAWLTGEATKRPPAEAIAS